MGFKGFEDEALKSWSSHSRKRTKLKPSGMERSVARAQGQPSLRRRRATAEGDIYIGASSADNVKRRTWQSKGDSNRRTYIDLKFSRCRKPFLCLVTSAVFFLFLSAVLSMTGGFTKVRCLLKKHLFHSLPLLLTLSFHSWIFWILQWDFIIMPDLYLTKYLPDRDDLKKKKCLFSLCLNKKK